MKFWILAWVGGALLTGSAVASDFEFTATKKKTSTEKSGSAAPGEISSSVETYTYLVGIKNRTMRPKGALEARYVVFIEKQEVGAKKGTEIVQKVSGTLEVPALDPSKSVSLDSMELKLRTQALNGYYAYRDGGRLKAQDSILGIWIKLYDGETEAADFANPISIKGKYQWDEVYNLKKR